MIFPLLNGILSFTRAPATWALLLLNIFVYSATSGMSTLTQARIEEFSRNQLFSTTQGAIFAQFIESHPSRYPASLKKLASQTSQSLNSERKQLLGVMAMRDSYFLELGPEFEPRGDKVAIQWWRKKFDELTSVREAHPSYNLGVSHGRDDWMQLLTYQFTHSGFSHLAGNMFFFLIFASNLELIIGSLGVLITYLFSGVVAALIFSLFSETSAIPLIGASGAVSGIMALFCVLLWGKSVRYMYFLLIPKRGYAGLIFLPAWVTLLLWFVSDLAGHWATPSELGGIAYSAHIGGEVCGILIGLTLLGLRYMRGEPLLSESLPIDTDVAFKRLN